MSSTICFDRVADAKRILKAGISSTSVRARGELWIAAWYLTHKTTYTMRQIEERLRRAAEDYFKGMPDEYIDASIKDIISSAKNGSVSESSIGAPSSITIYKDELKQIEALNHDDTERLAFIFLCVSKMTEYEQIYECNSDLFRLAWQYKYDSPGKKVLQKQDSRRVGGGEPTKRVQRICQAGLVQYSVRINRAFKLTHDKPPASTVFSVPIKRNDGDVAFVIDKPERDSLVLYYDRYKGYGGLITCERCGRPVLKTGRRQKYCSSCADEMNHHPEKRDL